MPNFLLFSSTLLCLFAILLFHSIPAIIFPFHLCLLSLFSISYSYISRSIFFLLIFFLSILFDFPSFSSSSILPILTSSPAISCFFFLPCYYSCFSSSSSSLSFFLISVLLVLLYHLPPLPSYLFSFLSAFKFSCVTCSHFHRRVGRASASNFPFVPAACQNGPVVSLVSIYP